MYDTLFTLLRTTLILTLCGGIGFLALRKIEHRLPKLSRLLWVVVLLTGWCWVQAVIEIPVAEQSRNLQIAEEYNESRERNAVERPDEPGILAEYPVTPATAFVPGFHDLAPHLTGGLAPTALALEYRLNDCFLPLWLGGMFITILLSAVGYIRILLRLRYAEPAEDALAEPWKKLLTEHGIDPRTIPMVLSQNLGPALVRTPLGYRLAVPLELWSELSGSGRLGILKHEWAHFRRRDVWKSFCVWMLTLPHWFNPIAHYAARRFDELAEQLCDREAFAGRKEGISEFARILLLLHENAPTHFVARQSIFGRNLKQRVASLLSPPPIERISIMRKTLLALGTAAILCTALFRVEFVAQETQRAGDVAGTPAQSPDNPALLRHWTSVIDAETQKPLAGVKATLYFAKPGGVEVDTRSTVSDAEGRILFPLPSELNADEEAGTEILVEKEGYVAEHNGRQAKWAERFLMEEQLVNHTLQLQKAESISGRLVDEQGKPLTGITVVVLRQKLRAFMLDGWRDTESLEFKSDADGRFSFNVAKDEKVVLWAVPENLAPKYVFSDKKRGDLGDITIEKGFEPVVTVLDKDGKPVSNVWVNIGRNDENYGIAYMTSYARSALTDQEGIAKFRPIAEGDYEIRISENPREKWYGSSSINHIVTWRAEQNKDQKPVKGTYSITPVKLSVTSLHATVQANSVVNVDVQFSDKTTDSYRELNANIKGQQADGRHFFSRPSSDSPSAYRGEGLFSFSVPIGLKEAKFSVPSDTNTGYRIRIAGQDDWLEAIHYINYPLGTIEETMNIEVEVYKSPVISLNVVNESGQPDKEYYAWLEYTKSNTPAKIKINDKGEIRVDITPERWNEVNWEWATGRLPLSGILDVSFNFKNFGADETKVNATALLPDEEMRLYIISKEYGITAQIIPKMAEGEERNLTITVKK